MVFCNALPKFASPPARIGVLSAGIPGDRSMPAGRRPVEDPLAPVRKVLRLKTAGVSGNEIARRLGVAPSTVRMTLPPLAAAGLSWPLPAEMARQAIPRRRTLNGPGVVLRVHRHDRLLNTNKSVNSAIALCVS
jgi:hypothetical protein